MPATPLSAVNPPEFNSTREWLIFRIESYLKINKKHGVTEASFGQAAIKDTGVVGRLRSGGDVTTRKLDALVRYMGNPNAKETKNGNESKKQKARKEDR